MSKGEEHDKIDELMRSTDERLARFISDIDAAYKRIDMLSCTAAAYVVMRVSADTMLATLRRRLLGGSMELPRYVGENEAQKLRPWLDDAIETCEDIMLGPDELVNMLDQAAVCAGPDESFARHTVSLAFDALVKAGRLKPVGRLPGPIV